MAAKEVTLSGTPKRFTVGTALNLNRTPIKGSAGAPPTVQFGVGIQISDETYLVDDKDAKLELLASNENPQYLGYTPEEAAAFYAMPMKTADGVDTVLGEFISDQMDLAIKAKLDAQAKALAAQAGKA